MAQHTFHQISSHCYWLSPDSTTDRPLLGVVAGAHGSLLVDAGNSPAHVHLLLQVMTEQRLPPPTYAMLTHWHWDHVFGTSALPVPTFASRETGRIVRILAGLDWSDAALDERVAAGTEIAFCRDMIKAELPDRTDLILRPPDIAFDMAITIDLGGVSCNLVHVGGDHAHDATIAYVPEEKILFLGDCLYEDLYHGLRRLTATQLFPLLDRLLAYEVEYYLGSHDPEPLPCARFAAEAALLRTIGETVIATGPARPMILDQLSQRLQMPLTDDHHDSVDAFLAGLQMPVVKSIW